MSNRGLLTILGLVVTLTSMGLSGKLQAQAPADGKTPGITSANDPTKPVPGGVRWFGRMHADCLNQTKNAKFDVCFMGDSITQMWPGDMFGKYFSRFKAVNFGIGGDRCENVLFRLNDGELQGTNPKVIVLLLADTVHLTRQGYEVWGKEVGPPLSEMVRR